MEHALKSMIRSEYCLVVIVHSSDSSCVANLLQRLVSSPYTAWTLKVEHFEIGIPGGVLKARLVTSTGQVVQDSNAVMGRLTVYS
jgi:hypothetical protein